MSTTQQPTALAKVETSPLIIDLATEWKITPLSMLTTLKAQVFPTEYKGNKVEVTPEMLIAFLQVCNTYKLNPFVKEIYAFPAKNGSIVPMVPIDGWANIINRNPAFDGLEFIDEWETHDGKKALVSTTCIIYRKDRSHPIRVTEYLQECYDGSKQPWIKWPARMLRHKALIQCARIAFSLGGIYDPDEAERVAETGDKPEIKRPTVINASAPAAVGEPTTGAAATTHSGGVAEESSTVKDQPSSSVPAETSAPTAVEQKEEAKVEDGPKKPGQAFSTTQRCFCTCCRNVNCDCLSKDEVDQCGCPACQQYMKLMRENPEKPLPTVADTFAPKGEILGKPEGPYKASNALNKLFAVAAGAGIQVTKGSQDDQLHKILKAKWGITSLKEIPVALYDEICKTIGETLKVK